VSSATYDLANRVLTFDGFPASHDNNGNLLSLEGDTYGWDVRNRLASLTGPGLSASFQYDALGRRTKKIHNGQNTEFMSDGINPLQEQAVAGANWTAVTMTGLGVDEILARGDFSGVYYYLPDGLGSTVALTDGAGAIHTQYTYTPFGETTRTGTVGTNPFQFTGRENDNTGLYYYRARYYHPVLQRFISEDPIEFAGGDVNLYAYTFNSPTNFTDPSGEIIQLLPLLGACFGGAALNVTLDVGVNSLLGGKSSAQSGTGDIISSAAIGCASGVAGLGLGNALGALARVGVLANVAEGVRRATNPRLQRTIDALFQSTDIVPGGTAGAIRRELRTGELIGGKSHILKGQERVRNLQKILKEENLSSSDRDIAELLIEDLQAALKGR